MEQPEEKPVPPGFKKPPLPPALGKKIGGVPKGPVPPRGPVSAPRVPPFGAMNPGAPKPPVGGLPKPNLPTFNKPPLAPPGAKPPMLPPPPAAAGLPPAIEGQLSEAESANKELENRIGDLEKKLLEEREKVLLASLRGKEEEAISAKVETSIKDIQDKLRREKKEQEMEEARRKAENRIIEMERRIAEEREAWVATLKSQLNQRDQGTQEMETHFSTRLKDLEYRWAQEKTALENAIREKDAEITRLKHEGALRSEQEKAFWEDRTKSLLSDKDKIEREFERAKDRYEQEKDHAALERQTFRDQVGRLENSLRFLEEQSRTERAALTREHEIQVKNLQQQTAVNSSELRGKAGEIQALNEQLAAARAQIHQWEFRSAEKEKGLESSRSEREEARRRVSDLERELTDTRRKYEIQLEGLSKDLSQARATVKEEIARAMAEPEHRVRTLQSRLDWYDNNIKHEYESAREKVRSEFEAMEKALQEAERISKQYSGSKEAADKILEEKKVLEQQVEDLKTEFKQTQWHLEGRLKEASDDLQVAQQKFQQAEQARANLEQELRQRNEALEHHQTAHGRSQRELDRVNDRAKSLEKAFELEREKVAQLEQQMEEYRNMLHGKGIRPAQDVEAELAEKTTALEKARETITRLTNQVMTAENKDDIMKEKDRVYKQMLAGKEDLANEFKDRALALDRKLEEMRGEIVKIKEHNRTEREQLIAQYQEGLDRERTQKKRDIDALLKQKEAELQKAIDEAVQREQSRIPEGPNPQLLEAQIRQQLEMETVNRQREVETSFEARIAAIREENKKEMDKIKWETESLREELKRARESRLQIEREAQELLQQAEDHYRKELNRQTFDLQKEHKPEKGLFTTLGRWLDTPLIDTSKKKDKGEEE